MKNLNDFLVIISNDHQTVNFPINEIQLELTFMYLDKDDFDNGLMKAYHKLKRKYNKTMADIFMTIANMKLQIGDIDFRNMEQSDYQEWLEDFFNSLENIKITRIEKNSPDGQMLTQMGS